MNNIDAVHSACCHALEVKSKGFNCAQACLGGLASQLALDEGYAMKLMAAFGGGMRHQQLCGAVVAAGAALGLVFGTSEYDKSADDALGALTVEFVDAFTKELGSTLCGRLLTDGLDAFDWDMPADFIPAADGGGFHIKAPVCGKAITSAVRLALEIIQREKGC